MLIKIVDKTTYGKSWLIKEKNKIINQKQNNI